MSSETAAIIVEASRRLFGDLCTTEALIAAERTWPAAIWEAVAAAGYPAALLAEAEGGTGLSMGEALSILRSAGEFALPLPLAETMLASSLLSQAGIVVPQGPIAFAVLPDNDGSILHKDGSGWRLAGVVHRVPGARHATHAMLCVPEGDRHHIALVALDACRIRPDENLAREARDDLTFDLEQPGDRIAERDGSIASIHALGAAARCCQMAGALDRVLEITVEYAKTRVQFGRPLGKFQAVQQNLAVLAAQVSAAGAAADMVIEAIESGPSIETIAAAKVRIGEAAGIAAAIAHQVHGAFGFTYEHSLHLLTKRLLSWREEFGNERYWSRCIGSRFLQGSADTVWPAIVAIEGH